MGWDGESIARDGESIAHGQCHPFNSILLSNANNGDTWQPHLKHMAHGFIWSKLRWKVPKTRKHCRPPIHKSKLQWDEQACLPKVTLGKNSASGSNPGWTDGYIFSWRVDHSKSRYQSRWKELVIQFVRFYAIIGLVWYGFIRLSEDMAITDIEGGFRQARQFCRWQFVTQILLTCAQVRLQKVTVMAGMERRTNGRKLDLTIAEQLQCYNVTATSLDLTIAEQLQCSCYIARPHNSRAATI